LKIYREKKKANAATDSKTHSLEKELLVDFDTSTNKVEITSIIHDQKDERVFPGNSGYGVDFVLTRDEIIQMYKVLEKWVNTNSDKSNSTKILISQLNVDVVKLKQNNEFLMSEKRRLIISNESNIEKLKKLNDEVRDRNREIVSLKLKLGLSMIKEFFPEEAVQEPAPTEPPKEESVKEEKPKIKPGDPHPFAHTYKPEPIGGHPYVESKESNLNESDHTHNLPH
jgi:hypothetical protein